MQWMVYLAFGLLVAAIVFLLLLLRWVSRRFNQMRRANTRLRAQIRFLQNAENGDSVRLRETVDSLSGELHWMADELRQTKREMAVLSAENAEMQNQCVALAGSFAEEREAWIKRAASLVEEKMALGSEKTILAGYIFDVRKNLRLAGSNLLPAETREVHDVLIHSRQQKEEAK